MATTNTSSKVKPVGRLTPVVLRKEVVEVERVVERAVPLVTTPPTPTIDYTAIINSLKADPNFLEKIKGEKGERGQAGLGAGGGEGASQQKPAVNYIPVRASSYTVDKNKLIEGHNIIGVNYNGAVTIFLPKKLHSFCTITVNDESGNASTNNITIKQIT